ncbi:DUF4166 domain-containing protein [Roseovarius sp. C7]|uniref:DUF4166 domain-containing protein n=1 Tax=Roseovarius sp. C7 TaxID=3398643 RepID=UPI0039F69545
MTALYPALLGAGFTTLPQPVQRFHSGSGPMVWQGRARVTRGRSLLARLAATLLGFPPEANSCPLRVEIRSHAQGETWVRHFGKTRLTSHQARQGARLTERFGPLTAAMRALPGPDGLHLAPERLSFLGVPLPRALLDRSPSFERTEGDRFLFDVTVSSPVTGLIVAYEGWLEEMPGPATDMG